MRALRLDEPNTIIVTYLYKYCVSWQKEKRGKAVNNKQKYYFYVILVLHYFSQKKENQKLSSITTQVCPLGQNN